MSNSNISEGLKRYWASVEAAGRRVRADFSDRLKLNVNNISARINQARGHNRAAARDVMQANQAAFNINARRYARTQLRANRAASNNNFIKEAELRNKARQIETQVRTNALVRDLSQHVANRRNVAPTLIARRAQPRSSASTNPIMEQVIAQATATSKMSANSFTRRVYGFQGTGPLKDGYNNLDLAQRNMRTIRERKQSIIRSFLHEIDTSFDEFKRRHLKRK